MHGIPAAQLEQHTPLYVRLTKVHEAASVERITAACAVPLEVVLAAEVHTAEGTDEWRAWVTRAAERRGVTGCPDFPPSRFEERVL